MKDEKRGLLLDRLKPTTARSCRVITGPAQSWRSPAGRDIMVAMSESSLQPGARVGNYILQELIGAGGFAQVWKAVHHERPRRVVAVKIAVEEDFRRALSREGSMGGSISRWPHQCAKEARRAG
jgi:serine/threonine protein kinase